MKIYKIYLSDSRVILTKDSFAVDDILKRDRKGFVLLKDNNRGFNIYVNVEQILFIKEKLNV